MQINNDNRSIIKINFKIVMMMMMIDITPLNYL